MPRLLPPQNNPLLQTSQTMLRGAINLSNASRLEKERQIADMVKQNLIDEANKRKVILETSLKGAASAPTPDILQFHLRNAASVAPDLSGIVATQDNLDEIKKTIKHIDELRRTNPQAALNLLNDNTAGLARFKDLSSNLREQVTQAAQSQALVGAANTLPDTNPQRNQLLGQAGQAGQDVLKKQFEAPKQPSPTFKVVKDPNSPTGFSYQDLNNPNDKIPNAPEPKPTVSISQGDSAFTKALGKAQAEAFNKQHEEALSAVPVLTTIRQAKKLLDSGVITGTGANVRLGFDKLLNTIGFEFNGRKIANTEAFAGITGNLVGKIIKQFGAGTGLSDADREFARKIAGSDITLSEKSIRRLLDIAERANQAQIEQFNKRAKKLEKSKKLSASDFIVTVPDTTPTASADTGTRIRRYNPATGRIE